MMVQYITENIIRSTHTITVKTAVPRQMLPIKKLNVLNAEWTFCSSFQRGEVSIALLLDYYKGKDNGVWAGLHGEIVNGNGYLMKEMTKMYLIRPGQNLYLNMRLFPESYYKRRSSNGRGHLPKGCFHVRITTTLAYGWSKLQLEHFLANNNTLLQSVPWPTYADRVVAGDPDCTISFVDGKQCFVNKQGLLDKLDHLSPFHDWHTCYPERIVFYTATNPPAHAKTLSLFVQLSRTNYIPWKRIEFPVLHELLQMAVYFRYGLLLKLCGVQLIHMFRDSAITMNMLWRLTQLQLSFVNDIINCYQVTTMVRPEVGSLSATEQNDAALEEIFQSPTA
ncbi:uncharacterized protein LOC128711067 [Anopheles marshallii]|uniref:uncharacterized protein LOC128711067 n=1 Tax=Anopheles marshallii TaxID=1521116 RepID=UPI00237B4795|nr:uncharacterized protein LOC128711067 [Anopheles marshallii]